MPIGTLDQAVHTSLYQWSQVLFDKVSQHLGERNSQAYDCLSLMNKPVQIINLKRGIFLHLTMRRHVCRAEGKREDSRLVKGPKN